MLWDVSNDRIVALSDESASAEVNRCVFTPDGQTVLGGYGPLHVWRVPHPHLPPVELRESEHAENYVQASVMPDGNM